MVFFAGLLLTGFGSAYYHLEPNNERLVWDRLPLAGALMGLFAAVIAERIGVRAGLALLAPLVVVGLGSVLWWHGGEVRGHGDLRPYALVQFYPLVAVPLMLYLFGPRYTLGGAVLATISGVRIGQGVRVARRAHSRAGLGGERSHAQAPGRGGRFLRDRVDVDDAPARSPIRARHAMIDTETTVDARQAMMSPRGG